MLIALNRAPELRIHIRPTLHNGLTEENTCEACRHAMIYCGVSAGRDAMLIVSDVIDEMKKGGEISEDPMHIEKGVDQDRANRAI